MFERRLRSSTISPVYLQPADVNLAIDKFIGYWLRSRGIQATNRDPFIDQTMVRQARESVLTGRAQLVRRLNRA
jgi:hypothetical protein